MKINKKQLLICIFLVLIAFIIRWYKLSDFLFFGFEQGRDAFAIEEIINLKHFPLIGPSTMIPGIFHGSYYYYIMTIPYFLGSGNPLFASFFLVFISCLTCIVGYFFAKDFFKSFKWGMIYSLIIAFNFEYILYSRWLSNVSPAIPLTLLSFFMLWKYSVTNLRKFLLLFVIFATFASSFEMILFPQFIFVVLLLFLFRIIKFLNLRDLILVILIVLIIFSPFILFDFRNNHIIFQSLIHYIEGTVPRDNFFNQIRIFIIQINYQFQRSVINYDNIFLKIFFCLLSILGLILYVKKNTIHKNILFVFLWCLMSIPLIFLGSGDPHNYLSIGFAWIFLFCFSLKGFWDQKKYLAVFLLMLIVFFGWINGFSDLWANKNIFFTTIQDDLNYKDQKRVLSFIHKDSKSETYRLVAFTIPYLHPEGWNYLHNYFYPLDSDKNAKIIYVIIEKHVASVWENKWISELGKSTMIGENQFGLLRVQKRILESEK